MKTFICKKSTQKTIFEGALFCIVALMAALQLTSCENFLNAKNVSDEIKDVIAYNNAKTVNVSIECKEEMGTVFPQQTYQAKVGYSFEVQFIPNTENFLIKNPEQILRAISRIDRTQNRSDCVEFNVTEQSFEDKKAGLYRIQVKVVKYADDILVIPDCTQLPKVQELYPPYIPGGYDQDTTIRITFNKEMNPESFGAFDCISIMKGIDDIKNKFGVPFFSNGNTVLNIPTKKGTIILGPESINVADITVSIDNTNITDYEGFHFAQILSYTYRINKNVDSTKPVIKSFELKTTQNTTNSLYKVLTDKKYENWKSNMENSLFKYGDFSQNHISDSVYLELTGYDNQSGVNAIKITETYYKDVNGNPTSGTELSDSYGSNQFVYNSLDSSDNEVYLLSLDYKLRMPNDGIIKLDFQLIDNANNLSDTRTYYVIKDSYIEANKCSFAENEDYFYIRTESETIGYDGVKLVRKVMNGVDNVVLTPLDTAKDKFFKNYDSEYSFNISWGYSEDSINNNAREESGKYTFSHDPKKITYIRITCSDEVGNKKSFVKVLLPQPYGLSYELNSNHKKLDDLRGCNSAIYENFVKSLSDCEFRHLYIVQKGNGVPVIFRSATQWYLGLEGTNATYKVWIASIIMNGDLYWYSALSDEYCSVTFDSSGYISDIRIVAPASNITGEESDYEPYMKDYINVYTEPVHNSGCYKVTLDNYKAVDLDPSIDVKYTFKCSSIVNGETVYSIFYEPTFYLKSNNTYKIYVEALDSEGVLYNPEWSYFYLNPDKNPDAEFKADLELTGDLLPPEKTAMGHVVSLDTADYWIDDAPKDNDGGSGMFTNAEGKGELTYYFIPSSSNSNQYGEEYTLDEVKAYTPRKYIYDLSDQKIRIPLDGIEDGLYTICIVSRDKNENYSISCSPAYRRIVNRHVKWSVQGNSSDQSIKINVQNVDIDDYSDGYVYSNGLWEIQTRGSGNIYSKWWEKTNYTNKWIKIDGYRTSTTYDAIKEGWLYNAYLYFDYEFAKATSTAPVYDNTNFIEGSAGLQFFTDAPVFVHTLYSEKKLTETNNDEDLCLWEIRGHETGVVFKNANFTYNKSQYNSIPAGSYYITIAHFADGTVAATDIKQK